MATKRGQKSLLERAVRYGRGRNLFEELERRALLSVTWIGDGGDNNWSNRDNWDASGGVHRVPTAADDVIIDQTAAITVDVGTELAPAAIKTLTITGNAIIDVDVRLNFDSTQGLLKTSGDITINQAAYHAVSLTVASLGDAGNKTGTLYSSGDLNVAAIGPDGGTGWTNITVNANDTLQLHGKLFTDHNLVNLTVAQNGNLDAKIIQLRGKDTVVADTSTATINGTIDASEELSIGGFGLVNFTVGTTGVVHVRAGFTGDGLNLYNDTQTTIDGSMDVQHNALVGIPAAGAPFIPDPAVEDGAGATLTIEGGAHVNVDSGILSVTSSDPAKITVQSGGVLQCLQLDAGTGSIVTATGQNSSITVVQGADITGGTAEPPGAPGAGRLELHAHATMLLHNVAGNALLQVRASTQQSLPDLLVDGAASLETDKAEIGGDPLDPAIYYAYVEINGGSTKMTVHSTFNIGDGHSGSAEIPDPWTPAPQITQTTSTSFHVGVLADVSSTLAPFKPGWADLGGRGTLHVGGLLVAGGIGADIIPSDSDNPFGTFSIYGGLDATLGMTLDSVLGTPGNANKLYVTGEAYISGDLDIYVASGASSTSYAAGDSFTVLTADGGLFGQFTNLPAGYYNNFFQPTLPALNGSLVWEVEYTGSSPADGDPANSVLLKVRQRPVIPTSEYATTDDITPSGSRINVGGGYADVTAAIYSTATVSMGALASGLAIAWNGDHSFGDYIDYYDSPTGGSSLELGGQFQVVGQVFDGKLHVAMIDMGWTYGGEYTLSDRLVAFYSETTFTPGMTTTGALPNMLGDLDTPFTDPDFLLMVDSAKPFIVAASGGTITVDTMDYTPLLPPQVANFTVESGNVTIKRRTGTNADIVEISDDAHIFDVDQMQFSTIVIHAGSDSDTITLDETNGSIGFLGGDISVLTISGTGRDTLIVQGGAFLTNGGIETTNDELNLQATEGGYLDLQVYQHIYALEPDYGDSTGLTLGPILDDPGVVLGLSVQTSLALGGNLIATSDVDSTLYTVGDSFTVVSAVGTLSGQFANLPEGFYTGSPYLPQLAGGLSWQVHYDAHDVTLTVVPHPYVESIVRSSGSPETTNADSLTYTVTFSEAVTGVDASDFVLAADGVTGASIAAITTADDTTYSVTVNSGAGAGTLELNLVDDDSITNSTGVALGSEYDDDGSFDGECYTLADTLYWNTTSGTWSSSASNWNTAADGSGTSVPWTSRSQFAVFPDSTSGTVTASGTINLTDLDIEGSSYALTAGTLNLTGDGAFTVNQDLTIASTITGSAGLMKEGSANLTLTGSNTYTGGTTVDDGTLTVGSSAALGSTTNALIMGPFGTLNLNAHSPQIQSLSGSGGTILNNGGGNVTLIVSFASSANSGTFSGLIENHTAGSGTVGLETLGSATLTLNLATGQTYTGATQIGNGSILAITMLPAGNVTISASSTLQEYGGTTLAPATWSSGTITGTTGGALAIYGVVDFTGGSWSFSGSTGPVTHGTLTLDGGSLTAASVTTYGTLNWKHANITMATNGFTFVNLGGTINFEAASGNIFTLNHFALTNHGTINFISGEVDFLNGSSLDNQGTVNWSGGTIKLTNASQIKPQDAAGATFTITSGSDVTLNITGSSLSGTIVNNGTIEWYGDTGQQSSISGGTINTH